MIILENFTPTPKDKLSDKQLELIDSFNVNFLSDRDGNDWYESLSKFKDDSWKLSFDSSGVINCVSKDASALFPLNNSVVELDSLPDDFSLNLCWFFDIKLKRLTFNHIQAAKDKQFSLMSDVTPRINELASAEADGDITESEKSELNKLREYRSLLRRVNISKAPDVNWPDAP